MKHLTIDELRQMINELPQQMTVNTPGVIACIYNELPEEMQNELLSVMDDEQRGAFVRLAGFARIMTDREYRDMIMAETLRIYMEGSTR